MHRSLLAALPLLALAACSDLATTPAAPGPQGPSVPGPDFSAAQGYIVVLREGVDPRAVVTETGAQVRFVYETALNGFAADLSDAQVRALRADPAVAYVERDAEVRLFTTQYDPYSWGLDRIDQRYLPLSRSFTYKAEGQGIKVYVLDTGINLNHLDVVGRAAYIPNGSNGDFVGDGYGSAADCHGHGSHVAGTVGGTYSGVAKKVTIYAGRVVNCSGGGTASMAIAGMDWIARNGLKPGVVNMSLGYGDVQSVRDAAFRLVKAGFTVVAAAGNGDFAGTPIDACTESPAGEPNVLTVGSTTSTDDESSFSNYGTCVDLLAPGSGIMSSDYSITNGLVSKSGTSMAAPHAAGVAALYLSHFPTATPTTVMTAIKNAATVRVIDLHKPSYYGGTPNRLLYTNGW